MLILPYSKKLTTKGISVLVFMTKRPSSIFPIVNFPFLTCMYSSFIMYIHNGIALRYVLIIKNCNKFFVLICEIIHSRLSRSETEE